MTKLVKNFVVPKNYERMINMKNNNQAPFLKHECCEYQFCQYKRHIVLQHRVKHNLAKVLKYIQSGRNFKEIFSVFNVWNNMFARIHKHRSFQFSIEKSILEIEMFFPPFLGERNVISNLNESSATGDKCSSSFSAVSLPQTTKKPLYFFTTSLSSLLRRSISFKWSDFSNLVH